MAAANDPKCASPGVRPRISASEIYVRLSELRSRNGRHLGWTSLGDPLEPSNSVAHKVLRVFRAIRFLKELHVMVTSIIGSLVSLGWSIVMLGLILFVFALFFVQQMAAYLSGCQLGAFGGSAAGVRGKSPGFGRPWGAQAGPLASDGLCTHDISRRPQPTRRPGPTPLVPGGNTSCAYLRIEVCWLASRGT